MRNKKFIADYKKTQKLERSNFNLKSWMNENISSFTRECKEDATLDEAHQWWDKKAHSSLEPKLATEVSALLATGAMTLVATDNPQSARTFVEVGALLLGIDFK